MAIVNPTSLANQQAEFHTLFRERAAHIVCCAENSATLTVQRTFSRSLSKYKVKSLWSYPVRAHHAQQRSDTSMRGQAAGVSMRSLHPCRIPWTEHNPNWEIGVRLLHAVVHVGSIWFQVITIYGMANGHKGYKAFTDHLVHQAILLSQRLPLPCMFVGDYNVDVHQLAAWPSLAAEGYVALDQLYEQQHGCSMPFTWREATRPDMGTIPAALIRLVGNIQVDQSGLFDSHSPVFFDLAIPQHNLFTPRIRYPQSWIQYGLERDDLHQVAASDPSLVVANTLQEWGGQVELLVHKAMKHEATVNTHTLLCPRVYHVSAVVAVSRPKKCFAL